MTYSYILPADVACMSGDILNFQKPIFEFLFQNSIYILRNHSNIMSPCATKVTLI